MGTGILHVYDAQGNKKVAEIILNGYSIEKGNSLRGGAMQSFQLVTGDLWRHWELQAPLLLRTGTGQEVPIKVAALPVEQAGTGLLEFV